MKALDFALIVGLADLGLYVRVIGFASPVSSTRLLSIGLLVGMVVGGASSLYWALVGAAFMQYVPKLTSDIDPAG